METLAAMTHNSQLTFCIRYISLKITGKSYSLMLGPKLDTFVYVTDFLFLALKQHLYSLRLVPKRWAQYLI